MKLFKDITIKQKLDYFQIPDFEEKLKIIKKWHKYYDDGTMLKDKEIEVAPDYTNEIFINLLGYHGKTSSETTFTSEYSLNGKRPDGVIGILNRQEELQEQKNKEKELKKDKISAVVELKSASIPLDQPQKREKNYTPIEQAFGYKRQLRNCPFVIVSNFYEIRLYNDNELDYEIWNLDDLVSSKDDYFNFRKFYYLLSEKNLVSEKTISNTESLLSEIRIEEKEITKKFYKDYKEKRHYLLQNLYKKNEILREDPNLLIEKGQKLIDRIIFMCFAEDRGLLPADTLQNILAEYNKSTIASSLKNTLEQAFTSVDSGNEKWDIPYGYNGGLFRNDQVLNDLKVDDSILAMVIDFGKYDFADQLSVTILGHIFEQSISDLEEIKAKIEEKNFTEEEQENQGKTKKVSKRKKDGIFYTPEYIVDYIVKNSLGKYLREKETEIIEKYNFDRENLTEKTREEKKVQAYTEYQNFLKTVKVLDPACGSGAFLVRVFDYLLAEHQKVGNIIGTLFDTDETYKNILQNNIYGVDLNQESVEITKLSLWLKSAEKGKKLSNLDQNIKCGNSLIDDPKIAGDKAFKWEEEFSEIMGNGGFDIIVGNPPYVFARDNISKELKNYYVNNYVSAEYQVNTYLLFIEQTIKIIKDTANYGLIIPNAWLMVSSATELRKYILQNCSINEIINLAGYSFEGVNVETIIILATKTKQKQKDNSIKVLLSNDKEFRYSHDRKQIDFENNEGFEFKVFSDETSVALTKKLKTNSKNLDDLVLIKAGLQAYEKNKGEPKQTAEDLKNRPYDYTYKFDDNTHKYLEGKDVGRYFTSWSGQYLQYGKQLASPRTFNLFDGEKIIIREITGKFPNSIISTYSEDLYLYNRSNIAIVKREELSISLKYVVAILNSQLMAYYFVKNTAKSVRKMFPKIILKDLRNFPFKDITIEEQKPFIEKADLMLELNKNFYEQKSRFLKRIKDNYELEKVNKKLEKFYEMEFGEFVKELRKQKAIVPLSAQDELEDYFDKNKNELVELDQKIKNKKYR